MRIAENRKSCAPFIASFAVSGRSGVRSKERERLRVPHKPHKARPGWGTIHRGRIRSRKLGRATCRAKMSPRRSSGASHEGGQTGTGHENAEPVLQVPEGGLLPKALQFFIFCLPDLVIHLLACRRRPSVTPKESASTFQRSRGLYQLVAQRNPIAALFRSGSSKPRSAHLVNL